MGQMNFDVNHFGLRTDVLRDVTSARDLSCRLDALNDMASEAQEMAARDHKAAQEKAERDRKVAEATIELNERTKIQIQLLREQNQRLNETIMQLKNQSAENSQLLLASSPFQFDVFVSHANDNKAEFVNALTAGLSRLGISIWYDANILDWGDNWKLQIANGLKKCRFGIVVISPEFLGREWTEKELNELLQRQNDSGEKVILPILYKMTIDDLKKSYPRVADFQAMVVSPETDVRDIVIAFARILIKELR